MESERVPVPERLRMPRSFGPFLLDKELWKGANSTVYLARDPADNIAVALKLLKPRVSADFDKQKASSELEAQRVRMLSHPNIITLHRIGVHENIPFISFPYIDGLGLDQALLSGKLTPASVLEALVKVCNALEHAHSKNLIHRDLKPRNIVIAPAGEPIILDWGLSWKMGDKSEGGVQHIVGTAAYMSPEQARGEEENLTPATDIWSLGAILYHLLTGKPPFEGQTPWKTMQMAMSLPPHPPTKLRTTIDLRVERVILWCLQKEPEKRYQSCAEVAEDLQRAIEQTKVKGPAGFFGRLFRKGTT